MDPAYASRYRELHERHWWFRAREAVLLRELERLRPMDGWRRALDVGCGDGLFFGQLRRYAEAVEGVESDADVVTPAGRAQGKIHVRSFDATFRPSTRYDLVLFLDVLEHLSDPSAAVEHAASLMEPGGVVLVTVPARRHLWTTHDDLNRHVTRYERSELVALLETAFQVERVRYYFRWAHAAKLAQRAVEAVRRPPPRPPSIPAALINETLYALCRIEEAVLAESGLPVGSSLIAVARKG